MAGSNWKRIEDAPKGIGPLLLRDFGGLADGVYVGYQDADSGKWLNDRNEAVQPSHFCKIPQWDGDEAAS